MENTYTDESTIDLVDMLFFLLKKWRSLLVLFLAGVILGGAMSFLPAKQIAPEELEEQTVFNMERAAELRQLYDSLKMANEDSVAKQLDINSVYQGSLKYYVQVEQELNEVRLTYQNLLQNVNLRDSLWQASGFSGEAVHVDEVAMCQVDLVNDNKGDNSTSELAVNLRVVAGSAEEAGAMLDILRTAAEELNKQLDGKYEDFSADKLDDSVLKTSASSYLDTQKANADKLNTYLTEIQKLESGFSGEELAYYQETYLPEKEEEEETGSGLGKTVKTLVIGAFLGCVIWGVWQLAAYLADGKIKTAQELTDSFGVPLLGRVKMPAGAKGLDGWLEKMQEKTRPAPVSEEYLGQFLAAMDCGQAALCGDRSQEEVKAVMDALLGSCPEFRGADFLSGSVEGLNQAKAAGSEVMVIRTGHTKRSQVRRELENSRVQSIRILGAVVVD